MADSAGQAAASTAVADVPEAIVEGGGDVVAAVKGNEDGAVEKEQGADMTNTDEVKSMEAMDDGEKEQAEIKTEIEASKPEVGNGQTGVEVPAHEKKGDLKRENPEGVTDKTDEERPDAKKQKLENGEKGEIPLPVQLGPKQFNSALEMFTWCYELLHGWSWNHDVNEYEFMVLSDLMMKGHHEAETKVGCGIQAFQIRPHPDFGSPCYYLIRKDGTMEDFSYRKCIDSLLPLPPNLMWKPQDSGRHRGGGRGGWGGHRGSPGKGFGGRGRGNWGGRGRGGRGRFN